MHCQLPSSSGLDFPRCPAGGCSISFQDSVVAGLGITLKMKQKRDGNRFCSLCCTQSSSAILADCALNHLHLPCMPLPNTFNTFPQLHVVNRMLMDGETALLLPQAFFSGEKKSGETLKVPCEKGGPQEPGGLSSAAQARPSCSISWSAWLAPWPAFICQCRHPLGTPTPGARLVGALGSH